MESTSTSTTTNNSLENISDKISEIINEQVNQQNPGLYDGLKNQIRKIKANDKRINLIFFGSMSAGKTTTINIFLRRLTTLINIIGTNTPDSDNQGCPDSNEEEPEYFQLPSLEAENTYFMFVIERSESDKYEIQFGLDAEEKEIYKVNNTIYSKIVSGEKIEFPNNQEGIEKLNAFFKTIDQLSRELLKKARKKEKSTENVKNEKEENTRTTIPIITIKVPNFSDKYRLVDTPGLSLNGFAENLQNNISNQFDFVNIFIFVNEIDRKITHDLDCEILSRANDHGQPIIYSFHTKGLSLMERLKKKKTNDRPRMTVIVISS